VQRGEESVVGWVVLIPRLPSEPSRHRVAVWRELRRAGAIQIGQGSWALPGASSFTDSVQKVVELVRRNEGDILVLHASAGDHATSERLRGWYDEARRAEWDEFGSECGKCTAELQREIRNKKFTLAELDEEEHNVDRLRRWHRELRVRDLFTAVPTEETQGRLDECVEELDRFSAHVYEAVGLQ
jgi:hypothetical protein